MPTYGLTSDENASREIGGNFDMTDDKRISEKAILAAMKLAAHKSWSSITLRDVADAAEVPLDELRKHIGSKRDILAGLMHMIDEGVLRRAQHVDLAQPAHDRLFEVLMSRFDALEPYKSGLKAVAAEVPFDPLLASRVVASQSWMLVAAGINADRLGGGLKSAGLATIYAQVFRIWLADDDPGLARTMAALDRRLRRGAGTMSNLDDACAGAWRICTTLSETLFGACSRAGRSRQPKEPDGADAAKPNPDSSAPGPASSPSTA